MPVTIRVRRQGYRMAHAILRVYWFVARPRTRGVKCVLSDGSSVLLVRHTYGPREWELPGGGIKRDEVPAHAARRELAEELGLTIDELTALGQIRGRMYRKRETLHCFRAEVARPRLELDGGELAMAQWFALDRLPADLGRYVRPILALSSNNSA